MLVRLAHVLEDQGAVGRGAWVLVSGSCPRRALASPRGDRVQEIAAPIRPRLRAFEMNLTRAGSSTQGKSKKCHDCATPGAAKSDLQPLAPA